MRLVFAGEIVTDPIADLHGGKVRVRPLSLDHIEFTRKLFVQLPE